MSSNDHEVWNGLKTQNASGRWWIWWGRSIVRCQADSDYHGYFGWYRMETRRQHLQENHNWELIITKIDRTRLLTKCWPFPYLGQIRKIETSRRVESPVVQKRRRDSERGWTRWNVLYHRGGSCRLSVSTSEKGTFGEKTDLGWPFWRGRSNEVKWSKNIDDQMWQWPRKTTCFRPVNI